MGRPRTKLFHRVKVNASGLAGLELAEMIRQSGIHHGFSPQQPRIEYQASQFHQLSSWQTSRTHASKWLRVVDKSREDGASGVIQKPDKQEFYTDFSSEVLRLETGEKQNQAESVCSSQEGYLRAERHITRWIKSVPWPVPDSPERPPASLGGPLSASPWEKSACPRGWWNLETQEPSIQPLHSGLNRPGLSPITDDLPKRPPKYGIRRRSSGNAKKQDIEDAPVNPVRRQARRTRTLRHDFPGPLFESNINYLSHRLTNEGADSAAVDALRTRIFSAGVSVEALMTPLDALEKPGERKGIRRKWQLLFDVRKVKGSTGLSCRLCPSSRRSRHKNSQGAVRHLRKYHFGFSIVCEHWCVDFVQSDGHFDNNSEQRPKDFLRGGEQETFKIMQGPAYHTLWI
jgi:hypothetical protein